MNETMTGLAYSLAGFILGYLLGRITARAKESVMRRTINELHGNVGVTGRTLGVVVIVLSVLTVASAAVNGYALAKQQNCIRDYNVQFAVAFDARAEAADSDRKALNTMLITIGNTTLTSEERRGAFQRYLDTVITNDEKRARNPLPEPPDPNQMCS